MRDIVEKARAELSNQRKDTGLTTGQVRTVSSMLYRSMEDKSLDRIPEVCEQLLGRREWALGVIAYDWAYRVRRQYSGDIFPTF